MDGPKLTAAKAELSLARWLSDVRLYIQNWGQTVEKYESRCFSETFFNSSKCIINKPVYDCKGPTLLFFVIFGGPNLLMGLKLFSAGTVLTYS